MISTAESLVGEYVWGQYDLLILPPSFPYGGMENPCLTFVTPTLLVSQLVIFDNFLPFKDRVFQGDMTTCS
jgi:aminopeptidase N